MRNIDTSIKCHKRKAIIYIFCDDIFKYLYLEINECKTNCRLIFSDYILMYSAQIRIFLNSKINILLKIQWSLYILLQNFKANLECLTLKFYTFSAIEKVKSPYYLSKNHNKVDIYLNRNFSNNNTGTCEQKVSNNFMIKNTLVNLSDFQLTEAQTSLLNKGLNFCPTPGEPNFGDIRTDLDKLHLNLRRTQVFLQPNLDIDLTQGSTTTLSDPPKDYHNSDSPFKHYKFQNPSKWHPPGPPSLEAMIMLNEAQLSSYKGSNPRYNNLSTAERNAIKELNNNKEIIIKPADKGGAIVILNTKDYIKEAQRQLGDINFYQKLDKNPNEIHNLQIKKILDEMLTRDEIDKKCHAYLHNENPRTANFYMLIKIHKGTNPPPGRPIISANNSPTERISAFVDFFLQPGIPKLKSFVKDTTHFLQKLSTIDRLPNDSILACLDVCSLYTNIPNKEAIRAAAKTLGRLRPGAQHPTNQSLIQLLDLVMNKNNFEFNGDHYLQISGTAMGTRVAPSIACNFMGEFENQFVYTYHIQPHLWIRFIDDIFLIWTSGIDELHKFIKYLNDCHQSIKFTSEISTKSVNFLDTTVKLNENHTLSTTLYTKPTDSHNYLLYDSCHPYHCKNGMPYSQFLRIRRICSDDIDFLRNATTIGTHFARRGYPTTKIIDSMLRALKKDRKELLTTKTSIETKNDKEKEIYAITTYHPTFKGFRETITKNWDFLTRSNITRELHNHDVIFGHRRNKNLKDFLIRSKIQYPPIIKIAPLGDIAHKNPCKTKNCRYCPKINKTGSIISTYTKRSYSSKIRVDCKSNNLIYCITCKTCKLQYVGMTKNRLMDRFQSHFYNITSSRTDHVIGHHFNQKDHNKLEDIDIHIVDFIHMNPEKPNSEHLRRKLEKNWQQRLHTIAPLGLNIQD